MYLVVNLFLRKYYLKTNYVCLVYITCTTNYLKVLKVKFVKDVNKTLYICLIYILILIISIFIIFIDTYCGFTQIVYFSNQWQTGLGVNSQKLFGQSRR